MAKLIIRDRKGERIHELVDDVTTIGRSSANIIKIKDKKSSRHHCRIARAGEDFRVEDLGSRNGIELNGLQVKSQTLRVGDEIRIGETRIIFEQAVEMSADEVGATIGVEPLAEGAAAAIVSDKTVQTDTAGGEKDKPKYVLEITAGRDRGKTVELGEEAVTIGRHKTNTLQIEDEAASNYHAEVRREEGRYIVADLGSTNGTRVAGEKIVKTTLTPGTVIQIGGAEIAFRNVGAPEGGEAVFGTVVLDQDRLDAQLRAATEASAPSALGAFARLVAAVLVLAGCGVGAYYLVTKLREGPVQTNGGGEVREGNVLPNAGFSGGVDDQGAPRGWRVNAPHGRVEVDPAVHRDTPPPEGKAYALRLARSEDAPGNARLACETAEGVNVDGAKSYELSGHVQSGAGGGLYGLCAEWRDAGRQPLQRDYVTVSGSQPEWKRLVGYFRPPRGARNVKLSCVAFGDQGSVWFDDVFFGETTEDVPVRAGAALAESGVEATFTPAGTFCVKRSGVDAIRGSLVLVGQGGLRAAQELARVTEGYPRQQGAQHLFRFSLFEFAQTAYAKAALTVSTAPGGVRMGWSLSSDGSLTVDRAVLVFQVQPAYAAGEASLYTEDGKPGSLAEGEAVGVTEIVFPGAKNEIALQFRPAVKCRLTATPPTKQLEVALAEPATLTTRPMGFTVEVLAGSQMERRRAEALLADVETAHEKQDYTAALAGANRILERHAKFEDICRRARAIRGGIEKLGRDAETAVSDRLRAAERAVDAGPFQAAVKEAEGYIGTNRPVWKGTPYEKAFADAVLRIAELKAERAKGAKVQEAERKWDAVRRSWKPDNPYRFESIPLLRARINLVLRDYADTPAAASAKKFLEEVILPQESLYNNKLVPLREKLLAEARNWERNGRIDKAIEVIEKNPDYQKHRRDLPELTKYLEELRKQP